MKSGAAISGAAHAALIAVVILGVPWFGPRERPAVPVTEVSFVTEAEFDRAQAAARAPRVEEAPAVQPVAPSPDRPAEPATVPEAPVAEAPPEPEPEAEPAPEPEQDIASLAPAFNPDAPFSVPLIDPLPPRAATPSTPDRFAAVAPPLARPDIPVASTPAPPPPEAARPAEAPTPEPIPAPDPVPPREERPAAAPPEAASDTPAEAEPEEPRTQALATSAPPVPRRGNIAQPASPRVSDLVKQLQAEVAREQSRREGATPPSEPTPPTVTAATPPSGGQAAETSLPTGPPITNSEKDGLRLAVQRCWNLPAGLRDASELKVVLAAEMTPDGAVINGSIRLIEPSPAPDARFQQAYEAGRRALIRCSPYADLPREKYAQWRDIEVVFNPEGMVSW